MWISTVLKSGSCESVRSSSSCDPVGRLDAKMQRFRAKIKKDFELLRISRLVCKQSLSLAPAAIGMADFVTSNPQQWLDRSVPAAPNSVLLSENRNLGNVKGGVTLAPTGLMLGKIGDPPADWDMSFSVFFLRISDEPVDPALLVTFLALGTETNLSDPAVATRASLAYITQNTPIQTQRSIMLLKIPGGTMVTIRATNPSSPNTVNVSVIQWSIDAHKVEDGAKPCKISCCKNF